MSLQNEKEEEDFSAPGIFSIEKSSQVDLHLPRIGLLGARVGESEACNNSGEK